MAEGSTASGPFQLPVGQGRIPVLLIAFGKFDSDPELRRIHRQMRLYAAPRVGETVNGCNVVSVHHDADGVSCVVRLGANHGDPINVTDYIESGWKPVGWNP